MDDALLKAVVDELAHTLPGARLQRAVQRGATDLLLDFNRKDGRWLIISTDANRLTLHLGKRPDRESDPPQRTDTAFVASLRKHFVETRLRDIAKLPEDRVVELEFAAGARRLVVRLTGNSADIVITEDSVVHCITSESREFGQDSRSPAAVLTSPKVISRLQTKRLSITSILLTLIFHSSANNSQSDRISRER